MLLLASVTFFLKLTFTKKSFVNTIKVSNGLKPDQDPHFVSPDLGPNCLQRLASDDYHGKSFQKLQNCQNKQRASVTKSFYYIL